MTQQIIPTKSPHLQQSEWLREYFEIRNEKLYGEYRIENVRFIHDPHWRDNWLSMQYVGDGGRTLIKGIAQPYVTVFGAAEDLIFWTWFDLLNKQDKTYRAKSLPPKLAPA
jgi:hypothetical protein